MKNYLTPLTVFAIILFVTACGDTKTYITKLDDINTSSIGAMTGTTGEQLAKKRFPNATIKSFDDIMDAIAALKADQLDAVITGFPAAMNASKHNKDLQYLEEPVDNENTCIAVRKGETELLNSLNEIVKTLHDDGTLKDMRRRWFKKDLLPYETIDLKLPVKGKLLKIGTSATREPFCFVDEHRNVTGHDGELARRISIMLNRPIEFVDMKFSALIPALKSGKIDVIVAGMTATNERRKSVDFTDSYFQNSQVILVKKHIEDNNYEQNDKIKLTKAEDIKDKRVAVLLGSVHDTYMMKHYPNAATLQYKSPSEILLAVRSGKVDAAIYTTESLKEMLRNDNELTIVGDTLFTVPIAMGFNKANDVLREKFNAFLKNIRNDGVFDDMLNRWIMKGETVMPVIDFGKAQGNIVVGMVSDKGLPFTVIKDNNLVGFDVELVYRFAAWLGKKPKIVDMEFGSLIAAAATNKIEMITSTLMITEERKKQIDFSDEYMRLGASVFALKKNVEDSDMSSVGETSPSQSSSFFNSVAESFHNNIILEKRYLLIIDGLQTTIIISILSILFGTVLGSVVCFMRMSRRKILSSIAKIYISILRGTPVLVLLMIIFYVVFASVDIEPSIVAVIAFGLNFAAYVSEMYRTGIEGVDKGQTEAGIALGFTKVTTFVYIVLPQAARRILPVYKGEVISLVKMTSIVGYIAVQDLTKASDIIRSRTFDAFFPLIMVAVLYFLISWLLMMLLGYIEKKTNPKLSGRGLS